MCNTQFYVSGKRPIGESNGYWLDKPIVIEIPVRVHALPVLRLCKRKPLQTLQNGPVIRYSAVFGVVEYLTKPLRNFYRINITKPLTYWIRSLRKMALSIKWNMMGSWLSLNGTFHSKNGKSIPTGIKHVCFYLNNMYGVTLWPMHDGVIKWRHFPRYWPFVREFTGPRWIPHTKASDAELWCFLWSASG